MGDFTRRWQCSAGCTCFPGCGSSTKGGDDCVIHAAANRGCGCSCIGTRGVAQHADFVRVVDEVSPFVGSQANLAPGVGSFEDGRIGVSRSSSNGGYTSYLVKECLFTGDAFNINGGSQQRTHLLRQHRYVRRELIDERSRDLS